MFARWRREREEAGSADEGKKGGRARTTLFASSITLTQAKNIQSRVPHCTNAPCTPWVSAETSLLDQLTPKKPCHASHSGYMPAWCDPLTANCTPCPPVLALTALSRCAPGDRDAGRKDAKSVVERRYATQHGPAWSSMVQHYCPALSSIADIRPRALTGRPSG